MSTDLPQSPGILRRLLGMSYELVLILALLAVAVLLPHLLIAATTHYLATPLVLWTHLFGTLLVYFVWFWSQGRRTLPMKTWHIRLVTRNGQALRPAQALWRYLWCWPSLLLGGIGILWALIDPDGQFLHDRLTGTRLIQDR